MTEMDQSLATPVAHTTSGPTSGRSEAGHDNQVSVRNVSRSYGDIRAVDDVSINVERGSFLAVLGPSGCGKTTLLRIVVGLERPDSGSVVIDGIDVTATPPNKRPTNLVFQHGALFPHMTVAENIAYGLQRKGWKRGRIDDRVDEMLALVQLDGFGTRRPSQLSGGQARRVGLARALAPSPDVLLLDEPLSALDLKLRKEMQLQLRRIHREVGTTFIYVTHDQEEALVMSDRIIVMRAGRIAQDASPHELYTSPSSVFVAGFIGETNLLRCAVQLGVAGPPQVVLETGEPVHVALEGGAERLGRQRTLSIRPELVRLEPDPVPGDVVNAFAGMVEESIYLGDRVRIRVTTSGGLSIWSVVPFDSPAARLVVGQQTYLWWKPNDCRVLPEASGIEDIDPQTKL